MERIYGDVAEIATPEQAKEIVRIHFHDTCSFNAPAGIRTLSPLEKCIMYVPVGIRLPGKVRFGLM